MNTSSRPIDFSRNFGVKTEFEVHQISRIRSSFRFLRLREALLATNISLDNVFEVV